MLLNRRPRICSTRMSSSDAHLRDRISSVKSAEKIVSALRLVAAARIRASSNAALRSRPFAEELQAVLAQLIQLITARGIDIVSVAQAAPPFSLADMHGPFLADPVVQRALIDRMYLAVLTSPKSTDISPVTILTIISAERKFCGSYNKDVLVRATRRIKQLQASGCRVELVIVGRVAHNYFLRHFPHIPIRFYLSGGAPVSTEQTATSLSHTLLSEFIAGGVQRVEIIYTRFVSLTTTVPSSRTLLPVTPTGIECIGDELFQLTVTTKNGRIVPTRLSSTHNSIPESLAKFGTSYSLQNFQKQNLYLISDEDAILLLNSMLPMYITSQLIRIIREAVASEQVSRLQAMTAATDNARELMTRLRTQYNKQRQAKITEEIIEVVSNVSF